MAILTNQIIEIYNQTLNGGMVLTGNTLQVVGDENNLSREFTTINGLYTLDWHSNGSNAYLYIPNGSTVVYAILQWFSTISNNVGTLSITSQHLSVTFQTPVETLQIFHSNEVQYAIDNNIYSSKWADVTQYVKNSNSGYYSLSAVPSVNPLSNLDNNNKAGWTLTVVYENSILPNRNICIYCGMKVADPSMDRSTKAIILNDINVPSTTGNAYLTMAIAGGTPNTFGGLSIYDNISKINNDNMSYKLGNFMSANNLNLGITPIVPYDNLFAGIIMDTNIDNSDYGNLDSRGTLGNENNSPYNINSNQSFRGNRSQLDILSFDISDKIMPNQNQMVLVADQMQNSDFNFGLVYGVQIDQNIIEPNVPLDGGPLLIINNFSKQNLVTLGDNINITLSIINKGIVSANDVTLFNNVIPNSSFLNNSLYLNGTNIFLNNLPVGGLNLGNIPPNSAVVIEYSIFFYNSPFKNPIYASVDIKYDYLDNGNNRKFNTINSKSNQIVVLKNPLEYVNLYVNKETAVSGDVVKYTIILQNTGKIVANNMQLEDLLPNGLTYVEESLTINDINIGGDLNSPISIPNLYPNNVAIITFKTKAN